MVFETRLLPPSSLQLSEVRTPLQTAVAKSTRLPNPPAPKWGGFLPAKKQDLSVSSSQLPASEAESQASVVRRWVLPASLQPSLVE